MENIISVTRKLLSSVFRFSQAIGHYTALAWSNTNRVGCGLTEYREGKWFRYGIIISSSLI